MNAAEVEVVDSENIIELIKKLNELLNRERVSLHEGLSALINLATAAYKENHPMESKQTWLTICSNIWDQVEIRETNPERMH